MVILSFEVSHDSVTDRRSRLQDNIRSRSDDTLVFSENVSVSMLSDQREDENVIYVIYISLNISGIKYLI